MKFQLVINFLTRKKGNHNKEFLLIIAIFLMALGVIIFGIDSGIYYYEKIQNQNLKVEISRLHKNLLMTPLNNSAKNISQAQKATQVQKATETQKETQKETQAQKKMETPKATQTQKATESEIKKNLENSLKVLQGINQDITAWLSIKETDIDYPVVQFKNNEHYLYYDIYGRKTRYGSIFLDYRTKLEKGTSPWIIYGHNMRDKMMFGGLTKYLDQDFFNKHRTIILETKNTRYFFEVFSVYLLDNKFDTLTYKFDNKIKLQTSIIQYYKQSLVKSKPLDTTYNQLLTLVTCSYTKKEARLILHALLKSEEKIY